MQAELEALESALGNPERPVVAVVGGAKVSTKLELLGNLIEKVDQIVIGGGMANTFLAAQGLNVGKSLCEHDLAETAREIMAKAKAENTELLLPVDVVVAGEFAAGAANETVAADACPSDKMILDAGPRSVAAVAAAFEAAKTLVWNGPLGAFEIEPFNAATDAAALKAAELSRAGQLKSVAGGGDTVAALNGSGAATGFTYISTAGGAFLEWMEGKTLPGVCGSWRLGSPSITLSLPHELWAEGAAYVREALGVEMPPGGAHPLMGTHNLLMSLGGECYLEVIAIDPGAPVPDHPRWYMLDSFDGAPRLQTWVTATKDMSVASADAHPTCGPARLQSRGDLTWQITVPEDGSLPLEGAYPSIIAWDQGLAPVDRMADLGCRLLELHVAHPKATEIEARLRDQA